MIRSTLYQLATNDKLALQFGASVAKPAAAIVGPRLVRKNMMMFSTKPRHDDELLHKSFSDAFDESDSLEVGKKATMTEPKVEKEMQSVHPLFRRHQSLFDGPIFRPLFRSGFDEFFRDPFAPFFSRKDPFWDIMPVIRKELGDPRTTLLRASPGYEIREVDNAYEIEVRIPEGLKADNLKIEVDDNLVHISGSRQEENRSTRFEKLFTIGTNVDADNMAAVLGDDNVLKVTAPKLQPDTKRTIPISTTDSDHRATEAEVTESNFSTQVDESDVTEIGKKELEDWNKEK